MKKKLGVVALFLLITANAFAQVPEQTLLKIASALTGPQYWTKGSASLLSYCSKAYPESANKAQLDYLAWVKSNAAFGARASSLENFFAPTMAKATKRTVDEWNVHITRLADQQIMSKYVNVVDEPTRRSYCGNFSSLLAAMFAEDTIKPRVIINMEELDSLKSSIPK